MKINKGNLFKAAEFVGRKGSDLIGDAKDVLDEHGARARESLNDTLKNTAPGVLKFADDVKKHAKNAADSVAERANALKQQEPASEEKTGGRIECRRIEIENTDDTEKLMEIVDTLNSLGYESRIAVSGGDMYGYVFAASGDMDKISEIIGLAGAELSPEPVEHDAAERIKNL